MSVTGTVRLQPVKMRNRAAGTARSAQSQMEGAGWQSMENKSCLMNIKGVERNEI